jgi:2Fe-2S ferredoxin
MMAITVRFEPSGQALSVPSGTSLLEAARRVGLPVASSCGENGVCARCGMEVLAGSAELPSETPQEMEIKLRNRIDPRLRLSCRVEVRAAITATAPYW